MPAIIPGQRKPRTLTGRVAYRMVVAIEQTHKPNQADFEYGLMLGAATATKQGLDLADFDNDKGVDAFAAIFLSLSKEDDRDTIYVTPAWRRVVISARKYKTQRPDDGTLRFWCWKASGNATLHTAVRI